MESKNKQKSNTGLKVIIVILFLALIGAIGYICYDKGLIKLPKKEVKEVKKKEDNKYDNKLSQNEISEIGDFAKEITNNFGKYYPLDDFSEIDNQDLLRFALKRIDLSDEIKASKIETEIENYFGKDIEVKHEDIECPSQDTEPLYLYEDGEYLVNKNHGGHGVSGEPEGALFYISSEKDGNEITVNYKILYSNVCSDTCILDSYYKSYNDSINSTNPVLEGDSSSDEPGVNLTEDLYKTIEVQLPVTTFKILKNKNGYTLKSVNISD